jgi:DNA-directed RNA polymerase specialized sigma24 family protein
VNDPNLEEQTALVREGRITAEEYFLRTKGTWERMACALLRRWRIPAWVERDEVVQELQVAAWKAIWDYESVSSNGRPIGRYVHWHATDKAKKKLHKMRNAVLSGNADAHPSRFEANFSAFVTDERSEEYVESFSHTEPMQLENIEVRELIDKIELMFDDPRERRVGRMLLENEGDILETAQQLFGDNEARAACSITEPMQAGRLVATTAIMIVKQLTGKGGLRCKA